MSSSFHLLSALASSVPGMVFSWWRYPILCPTASLVVITSIMQKYTAISIATNACLYWVASDIRFKLRMVAGAIDTHIFANIWSKIRHCGCGMLRAFWMRWKDTWHLQTGCSDLWHQFPRGLSEEQRNRRRKSLWLFPLQSCACDDIHFPPIGMMAFRGHTWEKFVAGRTVSWIRTRWYWSSSCVSFRTLAFLSLDITFDACGDAVSVSSIFKGMSSIAERCHKSKRTSSLKQRVDVREIEGKAVQWKSCFP